MQANSTAICRVGQLGGLRTTNKILFILFNFNSSNACFAGTTTEEQSKMQSSCSAVFRRIAKDLILFLTAKELYHPQ